MIKKKRIATVCVLVLVGVLLSLAISALPFSGENYEDANVPETREQTLDFGNEAEPASETTDPVSGETHEDVNAPEEMPDGSNEAEPVSEPTGLFSEGTNEDANMADEMPEAWELTPEEMELYSNEFTFTYHDYYYSKEKRDILFPDYFAGSQMHPDGTITMFVTDTDPEILQTIRDICGDKKGWIKFEQVEYSFNALYDLKKAIYWNNKESDEPLEIEVSLDLAANCVKLFYDERDQDAVEQLLALTYEEEEQKEMVDLCLMETYSEWVDKCKSAAVKKTKKVVAETEPASELTSETALSVKAGMKNSFYDVDKKICAGTIGFTAVLIDEDDGEEIPVVVTHGHRISDKYKYSTIQDGFASADHYYLSRKSGGMEPDYCVYTLRDATISSKRFASTDRLNQSFASSSSFNSIWSYSFYFYGITSGETAIENLVHAEEGWLSWEDSDAMSQDGDSGGPIYAKTRTGLRLAGIVSTKNQEAGGAGLAYYRIVESLRSCKYVECELYTEIDDYSAS